MGELTILLGILLLFLLIGFTFNLFGAFLSKHRYQYYRMLWNEASAISRRHARVIRALQEFEYYVKVAPDPPPFQDFDQRALVTYDKLIRSAINVGDLLAELPRPSEIDREITYSNLLFPFRGLSNWKKISELNEDLDYCLQESANWALQIQNIESLKMQFAQFQDRVLIYVEKIYPQVAELEKKLLEMKMMEINELDSYEMSIQHLKQLMGEVDGNLSIIPSLKPNATIIAKYRLLICESFDGLRKIEKSIVNIRIDLHKIEKAQKWCAIRLDSLKSLYDSIDFRLREAAELGLDVSFQEENWNDIQLDIQEAITHFAEGTPDSLTVLCGSIDEPGSGETLLLTINDKAIQIDQSLVQIENSYQHATELIQVYARNKKTESECIDALEVNGHMLDLSRSKLEQAQDNLEEANILISIGRLDALEQIAPFVERGQEFVQESAILREEFEYQLRELPLLLEKMSADVNSIDMRTDTLLRATQDFEFENSLPINNITEKADEIQTLFLNSCAIDVRKAQQSELSYVFRKTRELETELRDYLVMLQKLEDTVDRHKAKKQKIGTVNDRILLQAGKLLAFSQSAPLEEWLKDYEDIAYRIERWKNTWPKLERSAPEFEDLLAQAEALETDCLELESRFHQNRKICSDKISVHLGELVKLLEWIELRGKRMPGPSNNFKFGEMKKQGLGYQKEAKELLSEQLPADMQNFDQLLESFLREANRKRIQAEKEETNFKNLVKNTEHSYIQARDALKRIHNINPEVRDDRGNIICKRILDSSKVNAWVEELGYQKNLYDEAIDQQDYQSIGQLVFKFDNLRDEFRKYRKFYLDVLEQLQNEKKDILALNFVLVERIQDLHTRVYDSRLKLYHKEALVRQIEGVNRIRDVVRELTSTTSIITLLKQAIELAKLDLPDTETTNNYLNFMERQIHMSGGQYNEGANYGTQIGRDYKKP